MAYNDNEKSTKGGLEVSTTAPPDDSLSSVPEIDKKTPSIGIESDDDKETSDEPQYDFTSEEFVNIPDIVRNVVSFEDDPSLPVLTFRSVSLSVLFCIIGSIVSQLS